ncbi:MAG TPA: hypothetical protein IAA75_10515 [Candidatus Pullichristensenella avicola]|nr:hypothetical protein [Candidatus Pullichristensenella avicola]
MFGYVTVNPEALTQAQRDRFQAVYCGLCRRLRREYGLKGQLTLTFDMTFLLLTLSSLYEPAEESGEERCAPHPRKKHAWVENEFTAYAADMNIALAYHKLMDDWADERNLLRRVGAEALKRGYRRVEARWGEKCAAIEQGVRDLRTIEQRREMDVDAPANCFGRLLGELFVYRHDEWEAPLRTMGEYLGRFVYVMDAYDDLAADEKRGAYNPLVALKGEGFETTVESVLTMLIGRCTQAFEVLPLVKDATILRSALYSGVWAKYVSVRKKRDGAFAQAEDRKGEQQ